MPCTRATTCPAMAARPGPYESLTPGKRNQVNYLERFRVRPGAKVKLKEIDTGFKDHHENHKAAADEIAHYQMRMFALQDLLWADQRHSLLICLQAMDTGGKDGTINHVLAAMNPQGCRVARFAVPSAEEAAHDFLWRVHRAAPARGEVVIFNRSHYEDVLVVRVHNLVPKAVWSRRYDTINAFEKELSEHDTHILKFYLHISKKEQLKRFKARLDDPAKQWKISEADYKERTFWADYIAAYEDALSRCSTKHAPWFVIPADHKWFRNLAIARIVVEHLEGLKLKYPKPKVDLNHIRSEYHTAKDA
jgi:PPK2 family polyphosphate:nucleotide phosphotransferase